MNLDSILQSVCDLAVKVGGFQADQRRTFSRESVVSKHSHDYVSYVDRESEQMIVRELKRLLPAAGFITEEKTTDQNVAGTEYSWIVDPLDGTTNFIHDLGPWCVCIALAPSAFVADKMRFADKKLLLGVVYEVTRGELFYAAKGCGAWLRTANGETRRLAASTTSDLDQALVAVGYPYNAEGFRDFCMNLSGRLYGRCASLRSLGSAEAEICDIAAGRLEAYVESFINPWDVCAGAAIMQEAGGMISDYAGADDEWQSGRQVLATNALLHSAMLAEIAAAASAKR